MVGEERKIIYAHKCQLAARCEVFKAMFAVQKEEAQLESPPAPLVLSDIKPTIFLAVLEFVYTNCSSLSTEIVIDVLAASIEYGLDGLTKVNDLKSLHVLIDKQFLNSIFYPALCQIHEGINSCGHCV